MVARMIPPVLLALVSFPGYAALPDPTAPPVVAAATEARPVPALTAIRSSGTHRIAIIGGQVVKTGGRYQDARVVRIGETEVVLHRGGETTVLKLHPEAETRPRR